MSRTCGSIASARASPTRCFMPPEKLVRPAVGRVLQADERERLHGPVATLGAGKPLGREREHHLAERGAPGQQLRVLEDDPAVRAAPADRVAVDHDLAGRRVLEAHDDPEHRRLAAAALPGEGDDLARRDQEGHAAERLDLAALAVAEDLPDVADVDRRGGPVEDGKGRGVLEVSGHRWLRRTSRGPRRGRRSPSDGTSRRPFPRRQRSRSRCRARPGGREGT